MKKQITLQSKIVDYTLKVSERAKGMRMTIYGDRGLVVTVPKGVGAGIVERFMTQKAKWVIEKLAYVNSLNVFGDRIFLPNTKKEYVKHKEKALIFTKRKVEEWNTLYNFKYEKVSVRNQKSRWGSCSKKGNLQFNYKIYLLPEKLADYVVVHELCHLGQFNHSKKFWDLVAKTIPDHKERRSDLKRVGVRSI